MRKLLSLAFAATLVATAGAAQAADHSPAAQLARATAGRSPGRPVSCIELNQIRSSRIIDRTAILYDMGGNRLYVNRPATGATSLRSDLTLVTDTHSPRLCSVDIVRLYDSGTRMQAGAIGLGPFIPYTRPAAASGGS